MQQRRRYHPTDFGERQWHRLLAFALSRADSFECALPYPYVVQDLARAPLWPPELEMLRRDLVDRHVSMIRWELTRDYPTQFARFRLTPRVVRYVRAVGPIDAWSWECRAPRDPTFYSDDMPIMATDSVEGRIAVFVDQADLEMLTGSGIRLVEPLGVTAKPWPTP